MAASLMPRISSRAVRRVATTSFLNARNIPAQRPQQPAVSPAAKPKFKEIFTSMDLKLTSLDDKLTALDDKVTTLDDKVTKLQGRFDVLIWLLVGVGLLVVGILIMLLYATAKLFH
ncbi:hypothetical protein CHLRE_06g295350v5 [Chlamydomonas reinhardtii]|uniref:Uncharacterized protein n=1 Tax=Chlamydomonas reinhardtii TaxID=3055 RepID=A0A2K3DQK5_CHLRE|nr:uncharacterized protein CHLRE_06g295350v5 [Chlamydomonas reinhardtii]PNW82813.1 hypothetical protein CHLRE_06g295350v5 [Chlamydomonas reinhardtii]